MQRKSQNTFVGRSAEIEQIYRKYVIICFAKQSQNTFAVMVVEFKKGLLIFFFLLNYFYKLNQKRGVFMKNKAFTLIEVLVVVLIIGILAAIAVPQYQVAVAKSRIAGYFPFVKSLIEAQEVYYLQNGEYVLNLKKLDIAIPESCHFYEQQTSYYDHRVYCGDNIAIDMAAYNALPEGKLSVVYCPNYASEWRQCATSPELYIPFYLHNSETNPNEIHCIGVTDKGKSICQKFAGQMIID